MTFWKDEDGFSAKDFLMVGFVGLYLLEQIIVFILALFNKLPADALNVIRSLDTVVITVVGGTFGVQTVREFTQYRYQSEPEEPTYYEDQR
jgi:hypothetical protein